MEYHIEFGGHHRMVLSAKDSPDNSFRITEQHLDLSSVNLFMDPERAPDMTGAQHALIPLAQQVQAAFKLIDQAPDTSPVVAGLKNFRDTRLPELLAELQNPPQYELIDFAPFNKPGNEKALSAALKEAIARIDRELPHYFKIEKEIESFGWLSSGGDNSKIPIKLAPRREHSAEAVQPGDQLISDMSRRFIEFDATRKTAHVLNGDAPTAAGIVEALCNSGTLGREFSELNRGVMLGLASAPAIQFSDMISDMQKATKELTSQKPWSKTATIITSLLPGTIIAATVAAPLVINVINNAITILDLARAALLTVAVPLAYRSVLLGLRLRERVIHLRGLVEENPPPPVPSKVGALNTFTTSLIDQTMNRSCGISHILLSPKSAQSWDDDIPRLMSPDLSLIPSKMGDFLGMRVRMPIENEIPQAASVSAVDDFNSLELSREQIEQMTIEPLVRMDHIERAFETWNTFQAVSLLRDFCERQQIPSSGAPWFDVKERLSSGLGAQTDESHTYPEASQCFTGLSESLKFSRATWNQISRALAGASILERTHDTYRAREIAREVLSRHLKNA